MIANEAYEGTDLLDAAVLELRQRLPKTWSVELSGREIPAGSAPTRRLDGTIDLRAPNGTSTTFAVEAKRYFAPKNVKELLAGVSRALRTIANETPVLIVAPWLSPRTQDLLEAEDVNFLDLTGNVLIKVDRPAVYVRSSGARRNPEPEPRGIARVRGPKAGRLVRLLADVRPPYGVREIAATAKLAPGYVSRLLDTLDREALIERAPRGPVEHVDVPGLLRSWAESYDVLRSNKAKTFVARAGVSQTLQRVAGREGGGRIAVTGSFAAGRIAPVAAAALLMVYSDDPWELLDILGLIPADEGGDVALLRPFDPVVWERTAEDTGLTFVAPSQLVVDCLTGTGRMPAEGEAVLAWMMENEPSWRYESLKALEADRDRP